ncbi:MAG: glycosyltransferase family 9 protein [Oligoflexales bacterium]
MKNVVWLQTGFLGDIVLTTAAISLVNKKYPGIRQFVVTTGVGADVLGDNPLLSGVVRFDKRGGSFLGAASKVKRVLKDMIGGSWVDSILLQPHLSTRSSLLALFLGIPRITFRQTRLRCGAKTLVERVALLHEAHRIGLLLEPLGISREEILEAKPFLPPVVAAGSTVPWVNFQGTLVGIAPGSKWGTKIWPEEHFEALIDQLSSQKNPLAFVLIGEAKDRAIAEQIEKRFAGKVSLWNLVGKTTLSELKQVFSKIRILVSNDSAPIHFASAYNVPTVAIFGATTPNLGFAPLADKSAVCEVKDLHCRPCSDHGPQVCPLGHFRCMKDLAPDIVARTVKDFLVDQFSCAPAAAQSPQPNNLPF